MRPERITAYTDLRGREVTDLRAIHHDPAGGPERINPEQQEERKGTITLQREASLTTKPNILAQIETDSERQARLVKVHPDNLPCGYLESTSLSNLDLRATGNIVVIITGPFGGGKDTIANALLGDTSLKTTKSILYTSRPMGNKETNGVDYYFVSRDEFLKMRDGNDFLSWNDLEPGFYGVHLQKTKELLDSGKDVVVAVGPTVAKPLRNGLSIAGIPFVEIFMLPVPKATLSEASGIDKAIEILRERLRGRNRGKTDETYIELLMQRSRLWLSELDRFQHIVENPDGKLDIAVAKVKDVVKAKRQEVFESLSPREQFDNFGYVSESYFKLHNLKASGNIAVIISGPTGVGKGTIISKLLGDNSLQLEKGVGSTTRQPRSTEVNGVDYFFLTQDEFEQKIKSGELLEWTIVHNGNYYGYLEKAAQGIFNGKQNLLMELDPKGARFYRYLFYRFGIPVLDIFISPVPKDTLRDELGIERAILVLRERAEKRGGNETQAQMDERMRLAREWFSLAGEYSYIVENTEGNTDKAASAIAEIIKQKRIELNTALGLPRELVLGVGTK